MNTFDQDRLLAVLQTSEGLCFLRFLLFLSESKRLKPARGAVHGIRMALGRQARERGRGRLYPGAERDTVWP
jgi:hypothetical protein